METGLLEEEKATQSATCAMLHKQHPGGDHQICKAAYPSSQKKTEKYLVCWPFFGSLHLHVYQIFRREKDKKTIRNKSMTLTALNMEKNNQLFPCNFLISTGNFHCCTLSERNLDFINQ